VKRQASGELLWGVLVETEAYCQSEPACHGHRRRSPSNETLFGEPGRFYVYMSYGIHHCVNVVYAFSVSVFDYFHPFSCILILSSSVTFGALLSPHRLRINLSSQWLQKLL